MRYAIAFHKTGHLSRAMLYPITCDFFVLTEYCIHIYTHKNIYLILQAYSTKVRRVSQLRV